MALAKAKQDALAGRIAGLELKTQGWLGAARGEALARLGAMGLPIKRDEYWRYSDPSSLTAATPIPVAPFDSSDEIEAFAAIERLKIVFIDGVFDAEASDDLALSGVEIERLATAETKDIHWAQGCYGALELRGHQPVERPLAALNTAFASDGVLIRVTGAAAKPVALIYRHSSDRSDVILHHCVKLEPGAELTLLESGDAAARLNAVLEVELGAQARFHHIRNQGRASDRRLVTHIFARLAEEALFKSFTVNANGRMTRNEAVLELVGDSAVAHVAGATMGGKDFHLDDTIFITHEGHGCESRQVFKKVLRSGATGVFQGKILVKQPAQKTDGYQISQALLLDEDTQFLCKPELEIYADDVKCSHGSTSGAIDDTALFYLQSRGVPKREAQALLVVAFLAEAIDEIEDEAIADDIRGRIEGWLQRQSS